MAITRAQLLKELLPAMNKVFDTAYNPGWAVYTDYLYHNQEWRIAKVEQWNPLKHVGETHVFHVRPEDAVDEMAAYAFVMRKLGEWRNTE